MDRSESRPGSSLAVVAIPREDDYVWKVSSEKVPHMTVLFLGDQSNNPNLEHIVLYVKHVVDTTMETFYQEVDRRGKLGSEDADVLYFGPYFEKMLVEFRNNLLKDRFIKEAYDSTDQYPEWTRHLTLGYPATPAKPDTREYPGITGVSFDRVSVWIDDYDGPTFQLPDNIGLEVSMSDNAGEIMTQGAQLSEEILKQSGVKGMHWGVRKDRIDTAVRGAQAIQQLKADPTKKTLSKKVKDSGGLHKVSDADLKKMIERMEMEKKFDRFMKEDAKRRNEGLKTAAKVLGEVGKIALPVILGLITKQAMNNHAKSGSVFRTTGFVNKGNVIEGVSKAIGS